MHRRRILLVIVAAVPLLIAAVDRLRPAASQDGIDVYFSPRGGCTEAIVGEIDAARRSVQVQAYSFTSAPIAKAVSDAKNRGVNVIALLDDSQRSEKYTSATFLQNAGVPVGIDAKHGIAHNKVILIDGETIITGSFNFSKAAEGRTPRTCSSSAARQSCTTRTSATSASTLITRRSTRD